MVIFSGYYVLKSHPFELAEAGKGTLTVRDLQKVAAAHDFTWTEKELVNMIRYFDSDRDGKVCIGISVKEALVLIQIMERGQKPVVPTQLFVFLKGWWEICYFNFWNRTHI